jgi:hypothetical protein
LVAAALLTVNASAQDTVELSVDGVEPIRLMSANHDEAGVEIDGHLDESIWQRIEPIGELVVTTPDTLANTPYATDMRIFYTDRGLYVSFDLEQPPDTLIQRHAPRDAFDVNRDTVGITLDTSGSGRYGYWMTMALGDGEMDGTILPERQYGRDWDGAWYGATQTTDRGWAAEMFVPWSQMAMPKSEGLRRIGIYANRRVAHLDERWGWPALTQTRPRFMSAMQPLELQAVSPRQQWSIFPYTSGTQDLVDNTNRFKAGVDFFWRPSTNFQLTATVNPDFGSVESDNVVVNLTADETFFPEKRLFFQEGREIFSLSGSRNDFGMQPLTIVNTRRIGGRPRDLDLADDVELTRRQELLPADIIAATKATGQIGAFRYGVIGAFEDDTDYIASDDQRYVMQGRDFGVFRLLYEDSVGAAYRGLGLISTLVTHPDADTVVHASDFHYLTTSGKFNVNGQVIYSDRDESGSGYGVLTDATYTVRQGLQHEFEMSWLDDEIDVNDLGFQRRNDVTDYTYRLRWVRSGLKKIRNFNFTPFLRYGVNGDGFRTSNALALNGSVTFNNLNTLGGFFGFFPRRFDDRNSFGNGTFSVRPRIFSDVNIRTNTSKPLSTLLRFGTRPESVYGTSYEYEAHLNWQPRDNFSMEVGVQYKDRNGWLLHQDDGYFTAFDAEQWQPRLGLEYYPTSRQQLRLTMQWVGIRAMEERFFYLPDGTTTLIEGPKPPGDSDDFSISQLNVQLRYRWQIAPLSDLFIVYTKGDSRQTSLMSYGDMLENNWNDPLGDMLVVKLRYRLGS